MRKIVLCEEMKKLRDYLEQHNIAWEDNSTVVSEEKIEIFMAMGIPNEQADTSIYRTVFTYKGIEYSVINGYATYGGYRPFADKNDGKLELMNGDTLEVSGGYTAEEVIKIVGI